MKPQPPTQYRTGAFAKRASVSVRTLRYYDREGLLSPSHRSDSGHRFYSDDDLATLQQILALKFLGFSLREIRAFLKAGPETLQAALTKQKHMVEDRRGQLDAVLEAINRTQKRLATGEASWENVVEIIEVMQMEKKQDWMNDYFTPEQRETMGRLSDEFNSGVDEQKLKTWWDAWNDTWTEEDQKRLDAQYDHLAAELKRLVAVGADPAGEEAQKIAELQMELIGKFTQGDPDIEAGVMKFVEMSREELEDLSGLIPESERGNLLWLTADEDAFLRKAIHIHSERL